MYQEFFFPLNSKAFCKIIGHGVETIEVDWLCPKKTIYFEINKALSTTTTTTTPK